MQHQYLSWSAQEKLQKIGILVKSAESLEIAHLIDTVVLDKTGTITNGKPKVTNIFTFNNINEKQLLTIVGTLESNSEHPIAIAILEKVKEENISIENAENFEAISGQGIKAVIDDRMYYAGNERLMQEQNIDILDAKDIYEKLYKEANTVIFISNGNECLGIIGVSDTIKQNSKKAIEEFKKLKIETYMLTGDNQIAAEVIARKIGIDNVVSDVLPQEKEKKIREFQEQGKKVAMIGDRNK